LVHASGEFLTIFLANDATSKYRISRRTPYHSAERFDKHHWDAAWSKRDPNFAGSLVGPCSKAQATEYPLSLPTESQL